MIVQHHVGTLLRRCGRDGMPQWSMVRAVVVDANGTGGSGVFRVAAERGTPTNNVTRRTA